MFVGKWNKSVLLTYAGMLFAVAGMFLAFREEQVNHAFCCLMLAGICDLFDGVVARKCKRTEEEKHFGIELDSLVDVLSFIALPIGIFMAIGLTGYHDLLIIMLFALSGIARLAYFNTVTADSQKRIHHYLGLPVTYSALIFPMVYLLRVLTSASHFRIILEGSILVVSFLQISKIKIAKPKGIWYGIFGLLAVVMLVVYLVVL